MTIHLPKSVADLKSERAENFHPSGIRTRIRRSPAAQMVKAKPSALVRTHPVVGGDLNQDGVRQAGSLIEVGH